MAERFAKVADYLQAKLGVPVRYVPVKSYPAAVTAFTNNQVQLAWFGGFTGVQARRAVPGSEAIAQGAEDVAFKSYIIANSKTGIAPSKEIPKDIAGKTFTFGARASTSGRVMPEYFLRQANGGKSPDEVFSKVGFSGDHSRTIQLVQSGAFEVGVLDYSVWETEKKAGKVDETKVSVIWELPDFPRLSMDHPRGRGRPLWSRVQGEGQRGASGYRRQGDPGHLRPVEIHRGEERRLRTHRRRRRKPPIS